MANNCEVARRCYSPNGGGEVYEAWLNGVGFKVSTSDRTGTLRLKRTGTTMQAFYLNAAGWQLIGSSTNPQFGGQSYFGIGSFNYPNTNIGPTQDLKVAFDNLKITYPSFNPAILQLLLN